MTNLLFLVVALSTHYFIRVNRNLFSADAFSLSTTENSIPSPSSTTATSLTNKHSNNLNNKAAMIFLHGLGDSPDGWSKLAEALPDLRPNLATVDMTYVFPPAPILAVTVNGGEKMPGWFDVYDYPMGLDAKDDPKGLAASVQKVEAIVQQLQKEEGIPPSRVVIGGLGQGGAVALMAAYSRRKNGATPFAGCICLSGWLPMKKYLDVNEDTATSTPLFWAHGQYDENILFEQHIYGVKQLREAGVDVTACSYPGGHHVSADLEEINAMAEFLDCILNPLAKESDKKKIPKFANVGGEDGEDETNALLYYLCAMGVDESMPSLDNQEAVLLC